MSSYLEVIFGGVDFNQVTPIALVCIYAFSLVLECISSIIQSTLKAGGVSN